jgi:hypothetical protein
MANVLKVRQQEAIRELAAQGWKLRRIARELGVDRKTVRRCLAAGDSESPTISTLGSEPLAESKSPISTPGEPAGSVGVEEALAIEAGRPGLGERDGDRFVVTTV